MKSRTIIHKLRDYIIQITVVEKRYLRQNGEVPDVA